MGCIIDEGRHLVEAFIASGYRFRENDEPLLNNLVEHNDHGYDEDIITWLRDMTTQPLSLMQICRNNIRSHIRTTHLHASIVKPIKQLDIPKTFHDYLCLEEFTEYVKNSAVDDTLNALNILKQGINDQPLYFAMPRRRADTQRNIYVQFWVTTCCCRK